MERYGEEVRYRENDIKEIEIKMGQLSEGDELEKLKYKLAEYKRHMRNCASEKANYEQIVANIMSQIKKKDQEIC